MCVFIAGAWSLCQPLNLLCYVNCGGSLSPISSPSLTPSLCVCLCQYSIFSPNSWPLCSAPRLSLSLSPRLESGLAEHFAARACFSVSSHRKICNSDSVYRRQGKATPGTSQASDDCVGILHQTLGALWWNNSENVGWGKVATHSFRSYIGSIFQTSSSELIWWQNGWYKSKKKKNVTVVPSCTKSDSLPSPCIFSFRL